MDFDLSAQQARVLFGRTVIFAATDVSRPVLTGVLIEAGRTGTKRKPRTWVRGSAADGFRMGTQIVTPEKLREPGSALMPAEAANRIVKWCGPKARGAVRVQSAGDEANPAVQVTWSPEDGMEESFTALEVPGTMPDLVKLHADWSGHDGCGFVAFNSQFLADVHKAARLDDGSAGIIRHHIGKPTSPAYFIVVGREDIGDFFAFIMPMWVTPNEAEEVAGDLTSRRKAVLERLPKAQDTRAQREAAARRAERKPRRKRAAA